MKVLLARSAAHLAPGIPDERVHYSARTFSDGEKYIRVEAPPAGPVWVIAGTQPPAENMLELFFLLDALTRAGGQPSLIFSYFAYARQDRIVQPGECLSGPLIAAFVRSFGLQRLAVLHMHGVRMRAFLSYEDILPFTLVDGLCREADLVVAPDAGAVPFAMRLAERNGLPLVTIEKRRISDEHVEIRSALLDEARDKRALIVDDMISTGGTMMEVAARLRAAGAQSVTAYATHGVFSAGARERLEESAIDRIYVTNSLEQKADGKLHILDVSPLLHQVMAREGGMAARVAV